MKRIFFYPLVAALVVAMLWMLDDTVQYWNAKTAMGAIEAMEHRSRQIGSNSHLGITTYVTVAWDEDGLDRRVEIPYHPNSLITPGSRSRNASPYVGMKVPIVYVNSKPHLARVAVNHQSYRLAWIPLLLGCLFAWMEWRGKIPASWHEPRSRFGEPIPEDKSLRSEQWLKWHGKVSRSRREK
jgi:hypothetical protein